MAANFGKLFGRKKNKPQVSKSRSPGGNQADDSDEDDGYQDPTENCPTEPPGLARTFMPTYPPPRPSSPKIGTKIPQKPAKRDDYQDPWDSKGLQDVNRNGEKEKSRTDYEDPFDSKFSRTKQNSVGDNEDYSQPYESSGVTATAKDTYEDPWDTRKNIDSSSHSIKTESTVNSNAVSINRPLDHVKRDDYSDPWDSKKPSSFKSTEDFDDTYSDPYDTDKPTIFDKKVTTEIAAADDDEEDLYDMPEDEKNIVLGKSGNSVTLRSAFNQKGNVHALSSGNQNVLAMGKPTVAARPVPQHSTNNQLQGDYDAPWEWQAKNVEAEFAKRFSIGEANKQQVLPHQPAVPPRKKSSPNMLMKDLNINPVPKPSRSNFSQAGDGPIPYEVDPTVPLDNQGWFHGHIRRGEAEELLKALPDCSYLIRNSESNKNDFSLSLRNHGETMHLKISCRDGKYILGMNSRPYETIPDMIHYYAQNKLNIRGAEHVKLQFPVLQEAMYFTVEPGT